ncbi:nucleoside diphosphate-linked moiety X motif [Acrasis kona]|uniref:Nucleoside diphosphate-linked moiety X motif n=1 Tax=Acrasis kona TaxID=1008807 RepID=A0AAW2ZIW5_9EUKA
MGDSEIFTFEELISEFNHPVETYRANHTLKPDIIIGGAIVYRIQQVPQVLVVQRAENDSYPNKWEVPGGCVDVDDTTVVHGAIRELFEETGLKAKKVLHVLTPRLFEGNDGKRFLKLTFLVDTHDCSCVVLDPKEHQAFEWISRVEVENQRPKFVHQDLVEEILTGFDFFEKYNKEHL